MRRATGILLFAAVVLIQLGLRFGLSHDAAVLHVDPVEVSAPDTNNVDLIVPPGAPVFDATAEVTEQAVSKVLSNLARTELIATTETPPLSTWVTTSLIWALPDYTSIRVVALDDETSTVALYARSRFGQNDFGVNANRNVAILEALRAELESK